MPCSQHTVPLVLRKCRALRGKTSEEIKSILKDNGMCFKCCTSPSHLAKDCKVTVKRVTVTSSCYAPQVFKGPSTPPDNGWHKEEQAVHSTVVSPSCTQVCDSGQTATSCSKIWLVLVWTIKVIVRWFDQISLSFLTSKANKSLIRSRLVLG